jgi:small subunit ribosomal protein S9
MTKEQYFYAIGRRKTSSAQVKLFITPGESSINGKPMNEYVHRGDLFGKLLAPLKVAGLQDRVKFEVDVAGGGEASQVDAIAHGLSRALVLSSEDLRKTLRGAGLLTRDARKVERKKPGLKKARKSPTWSKR